MRESQLKGIFEDRINGRTVLYTRNLDPGFNIYGEKLIRTGKDEFREWNPNRSKLGAAILKGISQIGIKPNSIVLYLGAASGTTVSHVSDIVSKEGFVFAIEFSAVVLRNLVFIAERRKNISPIFADANHPDTYKDKIFGEVDVVFQDVSQRNQVEIFLKNCDTFLKKGGFGLLALKARSVDVTKKPREIFNDARYELEKSITVVDYRVLEPFEKDHALFVCKKR
tara:strand:+ start:28 stop:702 length:675 start_codon:yes stop_codon:yes gene_type:complete